MAYAKVYSAFQHEKKTKSCTVKKKGRLPLRTSGTRKRVNKRIFTPGTMKKHVKQLYIAPQIMKISQKEP